MEQKKYSVAYASKDLICTVRRFNDDFESLPSGSHSKGDGVL